MYQEGVLAATDPNRITWMSGTVNNPGTPSNPDGEGGMMLDNAHTPGCEKPKLHLNCYPLTWCVPTCNHLAYPDPNILFLPSMPKKQTSFVKTADQPCYVQENSSGVLARSRCDMAGVPK